MRTYEDFIIKDLDKEFIDKLLETYELDYWDIELDEIDIESIWHLLFTNVVIGSILTTAINKLDISNRSKEHLQNAIYCNCLGSWFNIDSNSVDDEFTWAKKKEKKLIKEFLDL